MSEIQDKLNAILSVRHTRISAIDSFISDWRRREDRLHATLTVVEQAEAFQPELRGSSARLSEALAQIRKTLGEADTVRDRFSRDTLCIGIGGAAGMGKSTFLQSVTGLEDTQIPTGDKYFTTATRSQIVNSTDNIAVVDFHSQESFLREIIRPLCEKLGIFAPDTIYQFRNTTFSLPGNVLRTQANDDILTRLQDAQKYFSSYEEYLTGSKGRHIPLTELRPFVAYPIAEGREIKAGKYLAVKHLVIRAPFPSTDVAQLQVVDLPGIGEAGIDLAKVQTKGMSDTCDVTFLVKRPKNNRISWAVEDSCALDAMAEAAPLLSDQTKFTAILANLNNDTECDEFVNAIRSALPQRRFEIIPCDARNREAVAADTMPRILAFMAKNLPVIDESIWTCLNENANVVAESIRNEMKSVYDKVRLFAPATTGQIDFARQLVSGVANVLTELESAVESKASGNDKEWDDEVIHVHHDVVNWIKQGCGYGSRDDLLNAICDEIKRHAAQPANVINECRVKFRTQWEKMDLHLQERIANLLSSAMDSLQGVLHGFIPAKDTTIDPLRAVRKQIIDFADRIDARTTDIGDDEALLELSVPLRRIAEFDLQFRFHLEPMLHATTHLLLANEFPLVNGADDAESFLQALEQKLLASADDYSNCMRKSANGGGAALEKKKRLLEMAIDDPAARADVIAILEQSAAAAQSFSPCRIFAAIMQTFTDAFVRSKNSEKAFQILAREWRDELSEAPDEKTRAINEAAGSLTALIKAM